MLCRTVVEVYMRLFVTYDLRLTCMYQACLIMLHAEIL